MGRSQKLKPRAPSERITFEVMTKPLRCMPGPRCWPGVGSTLEYSPLGRYSFDRLHVAKKENFARYGRIYQERMGPAVTLIQVFDPEDVARVLRADGKCPMRPSIPITTVAHKRDGIPLGLGSLNGTDWHDVRKAIHRLMMRPGAAAVYLPVQNSVADDLVSFIMSERKADGFVPNFLNLVTKYAMESIGAVCFKSRLGCLRRNPPQSAQELLRASNDMFTAVQNTAFAFPWYALMRTHFYKQFINGHKACNSIAQRYIANIQENEQSDGDFADCPHFFGTLLETPGVTMERVIGLTSELFIAGIDSTANALSFVLYNLSRNPDKQEILRDEISRVLPNRKRLEKADLEEMKYLKACVKESFRLNFPIEGGTTRILAKELELSGYVVPEKVIVAFNNQTMCLQEQYFDAPEDFIPERWLKSGSGSLRAPPRYVFLPFGYGPRMCIGRRFAEQEIYLAIVKIYQNFRTEYNGDAIGMINRVFTAPDTPIAIKFTKL